LPAAGLTCQYIFDCCLRKEEISQLRWFMQRQRLA
jgi:hypothetical protein